MVMKMASSFPRINVLVERGLKPKDVRKTLIIVCFTVRLMPRWVITWLFLSLPTDPGLCGPSNKIKLVWSKAQQRRGAEVEWEVTSAHSEIYCRSIIGQISSLVPRPHGRRKTAWCLLLAHVWISHVFMRIHKPFIFSVTLTSASQPISPAWKTSATNHAM